MISDDVNSLQGGVIFIRRNLIQAEDQAKFQLQQRDNEETADEMTWQGQRSGHIPESVGLKRC
jgi:hypothetical protein